MFCRRIFLFLALCCLAPSVFAETPAAPPAKARVAVWNPETDTTSSRFKIDLAWLNQVTRWLQEDGIETARLTAEQLEDAETFSAGKFDALMLPGDAFPRRAASALQNFATDGGILISLGAGPVPFLVAIENEGETWRPAPIAPDKAWESSAIYDKVLGLVYNDLPARRNDGMRHEVTPLFKKYLTAPVLEKVLPSRWIAPRMDTTLYPLIRSQRADGQNTVPQLFLVENATPDGTKTGLIAVSDTWTHPQNAAFWPFAKQTVVALAKIAADLRSGALKLSPDDKIALLDESRELPLER